MTVTSMTFILKHTFHRPLTAISPIPTDMFLISPNFTPAQVKAFNATKATIYGKPEQRRGGLSVFKPLQRGGLCNFQHPMRGGEGGRLLSYFILENT